MSCISKYRSARFASAKCSPCVCSLGPGYTLLRADSSAAFPGTANVTFRYWDVSCGAKFVKPKYVNAPVGWSGAISSVGALTWEVTQVAWGTTAQILLATDTVNCCTSQCVTLNVRVPSFGCTAIVNAVWDVPRSGANCLAFQWSVASGSFDLFLYSLIDAGGVVVAVNTLPGSTSSILIPDLDADAPYIFTIRGLCETVNGTQSSVEVFVPAVTLPPASLGANYELTDVTYDGESGLFNLRVTYPDYYCSGNFGDPELTNPPPGWTGTITRFGTSLPLVFDVTQVPVSYQLLVAIQAEALASCSCPLLGASGAPSPVALSRLLSITSPAAQPVDCAAQPPVQNISVLSQGSTCLKIGWTPNPSYTNGYTWQLLSGATPVQSGTIANHDTNFVTITGLTPSTSETNYVFQIIGWCSSTSSGPSATADVSTIAQCVPNLGPVPPSAVSLTSTSSGSYTATVTYDDYLCVAIPVLTWAAPTPTKPLPNSQIANANPTTWIVTNLPPGTTIGLQFVANPLTVPTNDCDTCCVNTTIEPNPVSFTFTTPGSGGICAASKLVPSWLPGQSGSTCLTYAWIGDTFPSGYDYVLYAADGVTVVQTGTLTSSASQITLSSLTPSTVYVFKIRGHCTATAFTTYRTVEGAVTSVVRTPALLAFVQTPTNPTFAVDPVTSKLDMTLTYPATSATCVTNLQLEFSGPTPPGSTITGNGYIWTVTNLDVSTSYSFVMTGTGAAATCANGCSGSTASVTSPVFSITANTPPAPSSTDLFNLIITNYGGPPVVFNSIGKLEADSPSQIEDIVNGPVAEYGSYLNQSSMFDTYSQLIVDNFIKFRMQNLNTALGYSMYLPISRIYFGNASDPSTQGAQVITPYTTKYGVTYKATYSYNTAISSFTGTFAVPPFLTFFKRMMVYNWEMQKGGHTYTKLVQLGANMFGSKDTYQWWFNATIDPATGVITTVTPSDPLTFPSIIDNMPNDGNGTSGNYSFPGWNAMERWFMHIAYCNQVLRKFIADGDIACTIGSTTYTMTLEDLTDSLAPYFQISCITTDAEENGFPNTLYPDDPKSSDQYYPTPNWFNTVTSGMVNQTIKLLWNKWINQQTAPSALPTPTPSNWRNASWATAYYAPQPRAYMPSTPFTLPTAVSMTTPGLIKNMTTADVGSPDFDAFDYLVNEIYDTSDSGPTYFPGADVVSQPICGSTSAYAGVPFTSTVQAAANPAPATQYAQYPEQYYKSFGTWDNIPANMTFQCDKYLTTNAAGTALIETTAAPGTYGGVTIYNAGNGRNQFCALMNTSVFNPWKNASKIQWTLQYNGPVKADNKKGDYKDWFALPWALEGSRYDLYNGKWAAAHASSMLSSSSIDYYAVTQGVNGADGSLMWSDLSTGLKPRVASRMIGATVDNASNAVNALAGQVWMLSCEAGPFVNSMGVRAGVRSQNVVLNPETDYLTFTCPETSWPGWTGMQGQWWGPGTSANANVNLKYALDQQLWGPYDPNVIAPLIPISTGGTEDNFGVFADFNIQLAAWIQMALDLQGKQGGAGQASGINAPANGLTLSSIPYNSATTGIPKLGCYELLFLPISWLKPFTPTPAP